MSAGYKILDFAENSVPDERTLRFGKLRTYMTEQKLSQADVARLIGIGESTISRWFSGDYPNPANIDAKVDELLFKADRRREIKNIDSIDFVMTGVSQEIWWLLEYCQAQKSPGCIYGDAGIGKTLTVSEWSKNRTDVVMLTAAPAVKSMKAFLKRLANRLKVTSVGTLDDIYAAVEEKLTDSDLIVIIDEAQHLSYATTENIRILGDTTGTSVIFVGNDLVNSRLLGKQSAEFAQVFSRLYMKKHLKTEKFTAGDIGKVFADVSEPAGEFLLKVAQSKYGLRSAVILYTNSRNNNDTTEKGLRAMAKTMGILL